MRIPLISRRIDPLLGVGTGLVAHYLYESDPKAGIPPERRLFAMISRRWTESKDQRNKLAEDEDAMAVQNTLAELSSTK